MGCGLPRKGDAVSMERARRVAKMKEYWRCRDKAARLKRLSGYLADRYQYSKAYFVNGIAEEYAERMKQVKAEVLLFDSYPSEWK